MLKLIYGVLIYGSGWLGWRKLTGLRNAWPVETTGLDVAFILKRMSYLFISYKLNPYYLEAVLFLKFKIRLVVFKEIMK